MGEGWCWEEVGRDRNATLGSLVITTALDNQQHACSKACLCGAQHSPHEVRCCSYVFTLFVFGCLSLAPVPSKASEVLSRWLDIASTSLFMRGPEHLGSEGALGALCQCLQFVLQQDFINSRKWGHSQCAFLKPSLLTPQ